MKTANRNIHLFLVLSYLILIFKYGFMWYTINLYDGGSRFLMSYKVNQIISSLYYNK